VERCSIHDLHFSFVPLTCFFVLSLEVDDTITLLQCSNM
jgi:hypothetical protein